VNLVGDARNRQAHASFHLIAAHAAFVLRHMWTTIAMAKLWLKKSRSICFAWGPHAGRPEAPAVGKGI
jgi:hypothetical protein